MNKSRHFKNSKWVESAQSQPSLVVDVWERRPGSDCSRSGQKPTVDQVYISCQIIIGNTLGGRCFKKITCQPSTVEIKEKHQQHPQPPTTQQYDACCSFLLLWIDGAKLDWSRSVGQSGQHRQSLKIINVWSGSSSRCAIAWWCQSAGYYYTVCSSEGHSPAAARFEWMKASPWEKREKFNSNQKAKLLNTTVVLICRFISMQHVVEKSKPPCHIIYLTVNSVFV